MPGPLLDSGPEWVAWEGAGWDGVRVFAKKIEGVMAEAPTSRFVGHACTYFCERIDDDVVKN